ncbi:MAG: DEAD/DEAH box helicase [Deltaproteobacteria bacterium]|nr:DEAD/DEAH box helicase [Deltaproteobacteria bacterium]
MDDVYKSSPRFNLTLRPQHDGIEIVSNSIDNFWYRGLVSFIGRHPDYGNIRESRAFLVNTYLDALANNLSYDGLTDVLADVVPVAHPRINLNSSGAIGRPSFKVKIHLRLTEEEVEPRIVGRFLINNGEVYRCPKHLVDLLIAVCEIDQRTGNDSHSVKWRQLKSLGKIKALAAVQEHNIKIDRFLESEDVVFVSEFGLNNVDRGTSLTIYPAIDQVNHDDIANVWDKAGDVQSVIDIKKDLKRTRIVFSDTAYEAAKILHERAHIVSGSIRDHLIANPMAIWDGAPIEVLQCVFGERVAGITDELLMPEYGAEATSLDWLNGTVQAELEREDSRERRARPRLKVDPAMAEPTREAPSSGLKLQRPIGLKRSIELAPYQCDGVAWMQSVYVGKTYRGLLLADEMGLGKTLQVLTFACWMREYLKKADPGRKVSILVLAPKSLYQNWADEIAKFFERGCLGEVLILDNSNLPRYKKGKYEVMPGKYASALDLDKVRVDGVVIMNRDLLIQYQFSLGQVNWNLFVFDEAQFIKDPQTLGRQAAFAMQSDFRIAMTGTPVENRLLDLWSIVDFVHAKELLGTADEFINEFGDGRPKDEKALNRLKSRLMYNQSANGAVVLRRTKKSAGLALPPIHVKEHRCKLSAMQSAKVSEIKSRVSAGGMAYMEALSYMSIAYQHPMAFLDMSEILASKPEDLLMAADRMQVALEILHQIKNLNEKVIIFTRFKKIAEILAIVLTQYFGEKCFLFNGSLSKPARDEVIRKFKAADGFTCLIASPVVGGVGLNLTEANHVIHYGRWWNPALERQCDARVHRKGQMKDVYIHHIIAEISEDPGKSFDENLNSLHKSKSSMADGLFGNLDYQLNVEKELTNHVFGALVPGRPAVFEEARSFDCLSARLFQLMATELVASVIGGIAIHPPFVGDKGADGIVLKGADIFLVQAKHTSHISKAINVAGIRELLSASGTYTDYLQVTQARVKDLYLVTNGLLSSDGAISALEGDVKVIDRDQLKMMSDEYILKIIRAAERCRVASSVEEVLTFVHQKLNDIA